MHMVTNTTEATKSEDFFVIFIITYKSNNKHDWDNKFTFFFSSLFFSWAFYIKEINLILVVIKLMYTYKLLLINII